MGLTIEEMTAAVRKSLATRIAACQAAGNVGQQKKWEAELKALEAPSYAQALVDLGFEPEKLNDLAIYATQKVRRLVGSFVGVAKLDPYTQTIIDLARLNAGVVGSKATLAALSSGIKIEGDTKEALKGLVRREGTEATASTQASSTRQALAALGAGRAESKGAFAVDLEHALFKPALA